MKTNLVLIGMTGSGKTSIGRKLSAQLAAPFIDTDLYIESLTNQTISALFEISEQYFRTVESEVCKKLASEVTHTVLSCGGGVVLNQENIQKLKQTGSIVFIDRPVDDIFQDIQTQNRPLLKDGKNKLYQLYKDRIDLYREAADFIVENRSTMDDVIQEIEKHFLKTVQKGEVK
ncbi:shikimate kinase [Marinilactibacillus psychrotolerans]|uniref:Shikimate kinase n=1 Tax=Marinilactibacillus psychrotolerans TaxID=191770 RepID=A0A5R9C2B5_9LACT|nr:shikimate kinase [Marinilactibacillus psychrotolerans]TLQ06885.1 shikimate kinase [Marinilactibacillus psychrotolerans]